MRNFDGASLVEELGRLVQTVACIETCKSVSDILATPRALALEVVVEHLAVEEGKV